MHKPSNPIEVAIAMCNRSVCNVRVGAVIWDANGIISWGWNSAGPSGMGQCAEIHAISRANRLRLSNSNIAIAGRRKASTVVTSFPCSGCFARLTKYKLNTVWIEQKTGEWVQIAI